MVGKLFFISIEVRTSWLVGCIEDLRRFIGISAISRLGSGKVRSIMNMHTMYYITMKYCAFKHKRSEIYRFHYITVTFSTYGHNLFITGCVCEHPSVLLFCFVRHWCPGCNNFKMAIFKTDVTVKVTRCQLKNFIGRVCIPNMNALSRMTPKLWTMLIFCSKLLFLENTVTAKATGSLILMSLERVSLVEYAFQIWSIYLFWFKSYDQC